MTRQKVIAHLEPMLEAQIAAVIGTKHLMLRNDDGTWRKATSDDDIEAALNGDPNMYYIAISPSSTQAFNTLAAYALDKPKEQAQDVEVKADVTIRWQE